VNIAHRGARKRSAPLTGGVRVRGQGSVLDQYLPHFDAVIRQGVVLAARPEEVYVWMRSFDFAQMCEPVGRAIEDMRAVPRSLAKVAAKARRVLPSSSRRRYRASNTRRACSEGSKGLIAVVWRCAAGDATGCSDRSREVAPRLLERSRRHRPLPVRHGSKPPT
jgi:hypothetical protein